MNEYRFRIRITSMAPLVVSLRGSKTACGTASGRLQDLLS